MFFFVFLNYCSFFPFDILCGILLVLMEHFDGILRVGKTSLMNQYVISRLRSEIHSAVLNMLLNNQPLVVFPCLKGL